MKILNTAIKVGTIQLSNRLVMPPMATAKSDEEGKVSDKLCAYYDEKSQGGYIGLIITEHSYISQKEKPAMVSFLFPQIETYLALEN